LADALRVPPPSRSVRDVDPDIADLVPTYLANRRAELARARAEVGQGRFEDVERIGHSMKGSGTPYGYPELTELGGLLEDAAGRADVASAIAVLERIEALLAESGG
jgi:HPt (histidine-containing phosphotransfer) domain-containing protein